MATITPEEVHQRFRVLRDRMWPRHKRWIGTIAAVRGEPDKVFVGDRLVSLNSLRSESAESINVSSNVLFQSLRGMVASAMTQEPVPVVALGRPGRDARRHARACERLLRWFYYDKEFKQSLHDCLTWTFMTGTGFFGSLWDLNAGDPQNVPVLAKDGSIAMEEGWAPVLDQDGQQVMSASGAGPGNPPIPVFEKKLMPKTKWKMVGDLRFFAPSPFDIFPEPAKTWSDVNYIIHRQTIPLNELKNVYGRKASKLAPNVDENSFVDFMDEYGKPSDRESRNSLVRTLHYYEKPSVKHPKGIYSCAAGDTMLYSGDLPGGKLPVHPVYDLRVPDSIWGECGLEQAVDAQRALNSCETDIQRNRKLHGNPALIADEGSISRGITRVSSIPGRIIQVNRTSQRPPGFLAPPTMPAWVNQEPLRLQNLIENLSGVHSVSKGENKGIMSGRQAAVVLSADRAKWGPTVRGMAMAVESMSEHALTLWRDYGPMEQTVDVYGPTGSPMDVLTFHRGYVPDRIKVVVDASTMMPYNEEIRRQQINEAWQIGAIPDIQMYWRLQRHGEMGRLLGADEPSRAQARKEQDMMMMTGQISQAFPHEDHPIHVDEHLEWMRSSEWYELPDEIKQLTTAHLNMHIQMMSNPGNPVLGGASPMPQLDSGEGGMNLAPTMNQAPGAMTQPGVNAAAEPGY